MATTLVFEGYGDDTFGEWTRKLSFDNAATGKPIVFEVKAPDGAGMRVWGLYSLPDEPDPVGTWVIGIQPLDEFVAIPPWPLRWHGMTRDGESACLVIEVPDRTVVRCLNKRGDR